MRTISAQAGAAARGEPLAPMATKLGREVPAVKGDTTRCRARTDQLSLESCARHRAPTVRAADIEIKCRVNVIIPTDVSKRDRSPRSGGGGLLLDDRRKA
jgi:hypothetical protein